MESQIPTDSIRVLSQYIPQCKGFESEIAALPWTRLHKTPVTVTGIRKCTRNLSELH